MAGARPRVVTFPTGYTVPVETVNGFAPASFDEVDITSYTTDDQPLVVLYKLAGVLQRTLTLTYSGGAAGGNLTRVVAS